VDWCVSRDETPDRALALVAPMWELCYRSLSPLVAQLAVRVLTRWPESRHPLAGEVAGVAATAFLVLDDHTTARRWAEASVALPAAASGYGHRVMAELVAWSSDDPDSALRHLDAAGAEARSAGRLAAVAEQRILRATLLVQAGRPDDARTVAAANRGGTRCRYRWEALHAELTEAVLLAQREPASAERRLRDLVADAGPDAYSTVLTRAALGSTLAAQGRFAEAAQPLEQALDTYLRAGMRQHWQTLVAASIPVIRSAPHDDAVRRLTAAVRASGTAVVRLHAPCGHRTPGLPSPTRARWPPQQALELARDLVRRVAATATRTGAETSAESGEIGFDGTVWTLRWGGRAVRLPDVKGPARPDHPAGPPGEGVPATALVGDPAVDHERARSAVGWRLPQRHPARRGGGSRPRSAPAARRALRNGLLVRAHAAGAVVGRAAPLTATTAGGLRRDVDHGLGGAGVHAHGLPPHPGLVG
jgi:hypothetical protein